MNVLVSKVIEQSARFDCAPQPAANTCEHNPRVSFLVQKQDELKLTSGETGLVLVLANWRTPRPSKGKEKYASLSTLSPGPDVEIHLHCNCQTPLNGHIQEARDPFDAR